MTAPPPASLHEQALRAHAAGDRTTAAALCREALARDPGHADAAFLLAAIAIEEGRPAAALPALDAALVAAGFETATKLLTAHRAVLERGAQALLEHETLDEAALRELTAEMRETAQRPTTL